MILLMIILHVFLFLVIHVVIFLLLLNVDNNTDYKKLKLQ